jgi:hypothetical protein
MIAGVRSAETPRRIRIWTRALRPSICYENERRQIPHDWPIFQYPASDRLGEIRIGVRCVGRGFASEEALGVTCISAGQWREAVPKNSRREAPSMFDPARCARPERRTRRIEPRLRRADFVGVEGRPEATTQTRHPVRPLQSFFRFLSRSTRFDG